MLRVCLTIIPPSLVVVQEQSIRVSGLTISSSNAASASNPLITDPTSHETLVARLILFSRSFSVIAC